MYFELYKIQGIISDNLIKKKKHQYSVIIIILTCLRYITSYNYIDKLTFTFKNSLNTSISTTKIK